MLIEIESMEIGKSKGMTDRISLTESERTVISATSLRVKTKLQILDYIGSVRGRHHSHCNRNGPNPTDMWLVDSLSTKIRNLKTRKSPFLYGYNMTTRITTRRRIV